MRFVLVVALALISPWLAEFVVFGTVDRIGLIVFLAPMYGSGAVLIREAARRSRSPWVVVALLGTAYGVAEACVIDMSLVNPDYDPAEDYTRPTRIPGLEMSAYYALSFVVGHLVWSIAAPIALVEGLAGKQWRTRPWLRRPGLAVCGLAYLGGAALIHADTARGFVPSPLQLTTAGLTIGTLAALALWAGRRAPAVAPASTRLSPVLVGTASFVASASWVVMPISWLGVGAAVGLLMLLALALRGATRHRSWTPVHTVAAAAGPVLTYVALAFLYPVADYPGDHAIPATERLSEALFTVVSLALVTAAALRSSRSSGDAAQVGSASAE